MTVEEVRKHEADFEEWFVKVGYMLTYPNAEHTVDINHDMKVAMLSSYLKGIEVGHKQGEIVRNTAQYKDIQQYKNALLCEQQLNIDLQKENKKLKNCANCKNCISFDDISGLRIFECKEKTVNADSVCEDWEIGE